MQLNPLFRAIFSAHHLAPPEGVLPPPFVAPDHLGGFGAALGDRLTINNPVFTVFPFQTPDQAFAQSLWQHYDHGTPMPQLGGFAFLGLTPAYHITEEALWAAVQSQPQIASHSFTEAQVWDYAVHEAPSIMLVAVPHA